MNVLKWRNRISFLLVPVMVLYIFLPCISYAQTVPVYTPPPNTKSLTYYYQGNTLMDTQDNNGYMSSYLGREIRTVIDTSNSTYTTDYLISDGKNIIADTQNGTTLNNTKQYNPYGKVVSYNNNSVSKIASDNSQLDISINPFAYDGYYYDTESGLYYLNARYYSPELMSFISRDTYDLANRYAYCNGNPIGNVDPLGHMALGLNLGLDITGIIMSAIGVVVAPFTGGSSLVLGLSIASAVFGSTSGATAIASSIELEKGNNEKAKALSITSTVTGAIAMILGIALAWKASREVANANQLLDDCKNFDSENQMEIDFKQKELIYKNNLAKENHDNLVEWENDNDFRKKNNWALKPKPRIKKNSFLNPSNSLIQKNIEEEKLEKSNIQRLSQNELSVQNQEDSDLHLLFQENNPKHNNSQKACSIDTQT